MEANLRYICATNTVTRTAEQKDISIPDATSRNSPMMLPIQVQTAGRDMSRMRNTYAEEVQT